MPLFQIVLVWIITISVITIINMNGKIELIIARSIKDVNLRTVSSMLVSRLSKKAFDGFVASLIG